MRTALTMMGWTEFLICGPTVRRTRVGPERNTSLSHFIYNFPLVPIC